MNVLVLRAEAHDFHCTLVAGDRQIAPREVFPGYRGPAEETAFFTQVLRRVGGTVQGTSECPEAVAVHLVFGGNSFRGPALYNGETRRELEKLVPQAPMHLPAQLALLDSCQTVYPNLPVAVVFETSFFTGLPPHEYLYGLPTDLSKKMQLRRYGLHGLYHQAACQAAVAGQRGNGNRRRPRILSLCLEPKPEIAAVIGRRPVMVTGGVSPLEGIPGQTTCGELDPGIVLALSRKLGWGPEQVNNVLTRESGMFGLTGRQATLEEILTGRGPDDELANQVLRYRILLACGAGIAAMGGLDVLALSGCYASSGRSLARGLIDELPARTRQEMSQPEPLIVERDLDSIVAEQATALVCAQRMKEMVFTNAGIASSDTGAEYAQART